MAQSSGRTRSEPARRAILDATRRELATRGWDRLSFERVASAAGVGKQTIYRWWTTKSALVSEMVLEGGILPDGPVPVTDDVRLDITTWMLAVGQVLRDPEATAVLQAIVAGVAEDAELSAHYDERITTVARDRLAERLREAVSSGGLASTVEIDTITQTLLASVLWCLVTRRPLDEGLVSALVATLLPPLLTA